CCTPPVSEVVVPPAAPSTTFLNLRDGNEFAYELKDGLPFLRSSYRPVTPLASEWNNFWPAVASYLQAHPERALLLTGLYYADEVNNSIFPNLGIARATDVKNHLIAAGVPSTQLLTAGELLDGDAPQTLSSGLRLAFAAAPAPDQERLDTIRQHIQAAPITLYFNTNANDLVLSSEQRQDFADLTFYLDQVPEARIRVSGYTDSQGSRDYNLKLSQERADFVRDYLVRNGLAGERINTLGLGPDGPVASNATEEGRALNRRVEVTLE
ncbi:MAG: cell envelope biogenesis protein OmpA, partial [Bacteroidetes bacterium]